MKKKNILKYIFSFIFFLFTSSPFFCFSQINPSSITGLQLWLKADSLVDTTATGSLVTQWNDCSPNHNNAIQSISANQPLWVANQLNSKPTIRFNGTSDYLTITNNTSLNAINISIFIVYKVTTSSQIFLLSKFTGGNGYAVDYTFNNPYELAFYNSYAWQVTPPLTPNQYNLSEFLYGASGGAIYNNSLNLLNYSYSGNISPNSLDLQIGQHSSGGNYLKGDIAEIIIYNQALNVNDRLSVENYLSIKYGGKVNLGSDIVTNLFCSTTLDVGSQFANYMWSTGATTQSINFDTTGTYSVTATNDFGYTSADTIVVSYPAIYLPDTVYFCSGDSVLLSTGLGSGYTYQWSNGKTTPTIYAKTDGKYWVTITDASLCPKISDIVTVVKDSFALMASLGNDTILCSGNSIQLTHPNPLPPGLTYLWTGGSPATSLAITASGTYSVTVTDQHGCAATDNINVTISGIAPTPGFSYIKACAGQPTQFTNTSSTPHDSFLWNFDDSNTSIIEDTTHTFTSGGTYNVSFTVGNGGCTSIITKPIHIPSPPQAAFTVDTACAGHDYTFIDQSNPVEGTITSWYWDFGDSFHSHAKDTVHTFSGVGTFNVSLTVQTDSGCSNTIVNPITIVLTAPAPIPFTLYLPSDSTVTTNNIIDFAWNQTPGASSYTLEYSTDPLFSLSATTSISNSNATSFQENISVPQTYYWRVIAYGICGDQTISSDINSFTVFSPIDVASMVLWLKADEGISTSPVSLWSDSSGNSNDAIQSNPSYQPLVINNINLLNYKPVVRFDGSSNYLTGDINLTTDKLTLFIVCSPLTQGTSTSAFSLYKSSDGQDYGSQNPLIAFAHDWGGSNGTGAYRSGWVDYSSSFFNTPKIYTLTATGSLLKPYLNGTANNPMSSSGNFNIDKFIIGCGFAGGPTRFMNIDIAEVILFNTAISTTDRQTVENYLHYKYAPPVNLGPDIWTDNFCDTVLYASKRFTNYLWSNGETTDSIIVNSGGTYWVSVTDVFGFPSSDTVIVHKPIVTAYSDTLCLGDSTTLHSGLTIPYIVSWSWDNDTTYAEDYMIHAGDTVMLNVNDTSGCSVNRQIVMHADNFPASNLLPSAPFSVCTGDIIYPLIDTSLIETYDWFDGTSHSYNGYYTITQTTGFTLTLTVSNARGCKATDIVNVSIAGAQPNVSFTFTSVCYPGSGSNTFNDNSTASGGATIDHYYWDFGDGSTANLINSNLFSHHYDSAAYYTVTLTDTTNKGCYKSVSQLVPVYSVPKPLFQPHLGCQGVPIQLNDHSTSTVGDISDWDWTFVDPSNPQVSSDTNPVHVFDGMGYYVIHLVVTTEYGCTDSITDSIRIRYAPAVGFSYTNVCDGNPVYFSDTTQTQPWALIYQWDWDFGNGQNSILENPVYTFDSAGTYNVTLSVHSINGCVASDTQQVVVHAIPSASLALTDYCAQTPYTLHDTSSVLSPDFIASWLWDFGSMGTSSDSTPGITFSSPGTYPVSLTVTSNAGCHDIVKDSIHVFPVPTATFQPSEYYCTAPCIITFDNSSVGALNYQWTFGDTNSLGSIQYEPSYTYNYNDSNGFPVVLYATNSYGCSDSAYLTVFVTPTTGDIMVSDVKAVKQNGFVTLSAVITNLGTRRVYSMNIYAKTAGGTAYMETWTSLTDPLLPGDTMHFTFSGQYQLSDQQVTEYICVEAQITNYVPDDDPTNNEQCLTFTTQFIAFEPYPSPVNDEVNIDFILPFEDNVVIELFGMKGDKVLEIYSGPAQKGLNKITLDVSNLALAVYTYRILFRDDQKILKFVKY